MKLVIFQAITLFSVLCAALPGTPRRKPSVVTVTPGGSLSLGAAYFMNNEPSSGNYLFAASIEANAKVVLRKAYYTGGNGGHGLGPTNDSLFSQGSIITSSINNVVIVVNAGSNTLTIFRIDPGNPTHLTRLGKPVLSGGDFPTSLTFNKAEDALCVLNTGTISNINCFKFDLRTGLTPLPNTTRALGLNQTTPPLGPADTGSDIQFSPDDKQLILTVKGQPPLPSPGHLAIWDVEADNSLSEQYRSMTGGVAIWSTTFISGKNAILSADPFVGYNIFDLDAFAANSSVQAKEYTLGNTKSSCWSHRSSKTGNYYLSDYFTAAIYEISIDESLNPQFVGGYPADLYDGLMEMSIASLPERADHLYALSVNHTAIQVYSLDAPGQARRIQKLDIGPLAAQAGIPFVPIHVYGMATWAKRH
ncbi:hypothetical protein AX17_003207 [Amanita inopinata Kibby_2008]|nr:hypothetical protein AX17_003207 [Amanita inopinata Kibby_2008]